MESLSWKYVKPIKEPEAVHNFLNKYKIVLPEELIQCITENNGGRPSQKLFDTDKGKEYVFKSLLSYNEEDTECIYKVFPELFYGTALYPIGTDASGNFICFDIAEQKYALLKHETNAKEYIQWSR